MGSMQNAFDHIDIRSKGSARIAAAFDLLLATPIVRFTMSMIPAGEREETLRVLLRAAFDAGVDVGVGEAMARVAALVTQEEQKREPKT